MKAVHSSDLLEPITSSRLQGGNEPPKNARWGPCHSGMQEKVLGMVSAILKLMQPLGRTALSYSNSLYFSVQQ